MINTNINTDHFLLHFMYRIINLRFFFNPQEIVCVCVGLNVCCTQFFLTSLGVFFIKQTNKLVYFSVSPHCSVSVDLTLIIWTIFLHSDYGTSWEVCYFSLLD